MTARILPCLILTSCAVLSLSACGKTEPSAPAAEPATGTVVRDTGAPPAQAPAPAALQTQAGPSGSQVSVTRAQVTGDVLTVQLSYSGPAAFNDVFLINEVSVVDDATAQKYSVLQSADGALMASPLFMGNRINVTVPQNQPAVVWFKFPAPPPTSPTVSINIPNVGPFDGVTVSR